MGTHIQGAERGHGVDKNGQVDTKIRKLTPAHLANKGMKNSHT